MGRRKDSEVRFEAERDAKAEAREKRRGRLIRAALGCIASGDAGTWGFRTDECRGRLSIDAGGIALGIVATPADEPDAGREGGGDASPKRRKSAKRRGRKRGTGLASVAPEAGSSAEG